jgi:L-2-hydroxyglutarate oxidase LhgO
LTASKNYHFDFLIVGAGILGLTIARELRFKFPNSTIGLIEKENEAGMHASGRNSGVIHSGIYYANDTLKARTCSLGGSLMMEFAKESNINFKRSGKVIIATSEDQLPTVDKLIKNAVDNKIEAELIDSQQLNELEPYAFKGPAAIYVPTTAVIDIKAVIKRLHSDLQADRVKFLFGCKLISISKKDTIRTSRGIHKYGYLINCAGAYADIIAKLFGIAEDFTLLPFKGIYWKLDSKSNYKVKSNIYPVPDIKMPFLGVHLTRGIDEEVYIGPTSMPAFGRENYKGFEGINLKDFAKIGFYGLNMYFKNTNNFRSLTHSEISKYYKNNFLMDAKRLMPSLMKKDLIFTPKSGIRPQLINTKTKSLEMDFIILNTQNSLHILNSISPAWTSSFAIAKQIVNNIN